MVELQDRISVEKMAHEAAKHALHTLINRDSYFAEEDSKRDEMFRKETIKSALQIKKKYL